MEKQLWRRLAAGDADTPRTMQADEYRKLAETEDRMWYFRALHRRLAHWLARLLPTDGLAGARPSSAVRVLDAGCGTGGFLKSPQVKDRGWQLTGVDLSPLAVQLARERSGADVREGSITALPFADESFDAVVTGDVIYHAEDVALALREFARCVKPGGVVLVNEPAYRWLWSYHDNAVESKHRFTRPELKALFRQAGLEVVFASYANMLMLPLVILRRKVFPPKQPTSDVHLYPAPIEAIFSAMTWLEQAWIGRGLPLPAGSTVFVAGVKPVAAAGK
jgi:SAM-dependent methyltransferase